MNAWTEKSPLKLARTAGFLYLLLVPLGFFSMYASSQVVPGDAAATMNKIMAHEALFRLSIVSALLTQVVNIFVVLALYKLLRPVHSIHAALMVVFILAAVPIAMLNELNHFALLTLSGAGSSTIYTADRLRSLVPVFFSLHEYGTAVAGIFWGLWLFPMGYLVYRSGFIPRVIGVFLIIACLGYLVDSFALFLTSDYEVNVAVYTFWGELFLLLWLLIKGVDVEKWKKRALESTASAYDTTDARL